MADKKCAHPACNCMPPKGEKYCSPYCHDAGTLTELVCNCGHPGIGVIEGTLLDAGDSIVTIAVVNTQRRDGVENLWAGEPVPVPRSLVSDLSVRRADKARTATAIGIAAAAVIAIGLAFVVKGNGSGTGGPGSEPR